MGQTGHLDGSSVGARDPLTRLCHRYVDALVLILETSLGQNL